MGQCGDIGIGRCENWQTKNAISQGKKFEWRKAYTVRGGETEMEACLSLFTQQSMTQRLKLVLITSEQTSRGTLHTSANYTVLLPLPYNMRKGNPFHSRQFYDTVNSVLQIINIAPFTNVFHNTALMRTSGA